MGFHCVHQLFSEAASRFPSHIAITCGERSLTYRELELRTHALARHLIAQGTKKADVVAVLVEDPIELVSGLLATLKAGAAFLALDVEYPPARLQALLQEATPRILLLGHGLESRLDAIALDRGRTQVVPSRSGAEATEEGSPPLPVASAPEELCYLYFTSGSTGRPKAIMGNHRGLEHFIRWEIDYLGLEQGVRVSLLSRPSFDVFLRDVLVPLCCGGTLCAPPDRSHVLDPARLAAWLEAERVNLIHIVPTLLRALLKYELKPGSLPALRYALPAGEMLYPSDVARWQAIFEQRVKLFNLYGPTETTLAKFCYPVQPHDRDRRGSIPVGQPLPGTEAIVVDDLGAIASPGTVGELYIRTPFRSHGYFNQPEQTAQAFIPNPFSSDPDDIVYKTGDLARVLEDGNLQLVGRKDRQVKVRGVRIELDEIERALLQHPSVGHVAVIDWAAEEGEKYLSAYFIPTAPVDASQLTEHLAQRLPREMVPAYFVEMAELPRTLSGKIDRKALPQPHQAQAQQQNPHVAPRTPTEEIICELAAKVLGRDKVSANMGFFAAGGNSLQAMVFLSRVRSHFEVELPLGALFENPNLAHLSQIVDRQRQASARPVSAIPRVER